MQRLIDEGQILLNGKKVVKRQNVVAGNVIEVTSPLLSTRDQRPLPQNIPLSTLFEDDYLLAVNKPAGIVVHPGHGNYNGTLVNALLFRGSALSAGSSIERPGIVHRLDKETSGVLLIAKNNAVHARLADAFAKRTVTKQYLGICIGRPPTQKGIIDLPLDRSRKEPLKRSVSVHGKVSVTSYELLTCRCGISVVNFYPRTGRTHQIRVHCNAAGFPILADRLYGGGKERILRIDPVERPFAYKVYKCFSRQALHANRITFSHPETGNLTTIDAPLPDDFRNAFLLFNEPGVLSKF